MKALLLRFLSDERGYAGLEWAFVTTILVLGGITGVVVARQAALSGQSNEPVLLLRR